MTKPPPYGRRIGKRQAVLLMRPAAAINIATELDL